MTLTSCILSFLIGFHGVHKGIRYSVWCFLVCLVGIVVQVPGGLCIVQRRLSSLGGRNVDKIRSVSGYRIVFLRRENVSLTSCLNGAGTGQFEL